MNEQQVKEFLRIWKELSNENKIAVLEYARRLLVNQQIERNRQSTPKGQ